MSAVSSMFHVVINTYHIISQREHHKTRTFEDEYQEIIEACGLQWNDFRLTCSGW